MLKKFKSIAHLYEDYNQLPYDNSKFGWLSLMQHHGCPTRLVDFTTMPFMALYFAIDGASIYSSNKCAIYCLSYRNINSLTMGTLSQNKDVSKEELARRLSNDPDQFYCDYVDLGADELIYCMEPLKLNLRLRQQGGTFLICNQISCKIQDAVDKYELYKDIVVDKILISHGIIPEISIMLQKMGITNKQIYPGLDGLSKDISQEMTNYIALGMRRAKLTP